jgi:hypothetical protein
VALTPLKLRVKPKEPIYLVESIIAVGNSELSIEMIA